MLPTEKTKEDIPINKLKVLLYGDPKIGISTFCSKFYNALFLATDAIDAIDAYKVSIDSWETMLSVAAELAESKHPYEVLVIDSIDSAYRLCEEYICKQRGIEHESDLGFGKGQGLASSEFHRFLSKLCKLGYGIYMTSHVHTKTIRQTTGEWTKMIPTLKDKALQVVYNISDMILYCTTETTKNEDDLVTNSKMIYTSPSQNYDAGDTTGKLPWCLSLGFDLFKHKYEMGSISLSGKRKSENIKEVNKYKRSRE